MPKRAKPIKQESHAEARQRKRWLKALGIARILFEADGYHTAYLNEIEAFLHQHPVPTLDTPHALDEQTKTRVARLAERMGSGTYWCNDPQDPRWGTEEDLGHVCEELRQLVANDPQAAAAFFAVYASERCDEPGARDTHAAEPPAPVESRYHIDHYPHSRSRFWSGGAGNA